MTPMTTVLRELFVSARHTIVFAVMTVLFTLLITGIAQLFFNNQANGSLVTQNGKVVGSTLIGQSCPKESKAKDGSLLVTIDHPNLFQGRLSWTLDANGNLLPCNAANSAGSNLGPSNPLLAETTEAAVKAYHAQGVTGDVPVDLVTSDFTGFDPDISEAAALAQVPMVARARGVDQNTLTSLVESHLQGRILWIFGEPHINVLQLNMALQQQSGGH
jgi:K+-transporting ATPase ATPase C chain